MGSLTQLQESVIIGSVLGDGYVRRVPGRCNALMEFNHSFKQREYVDWKFEKLKNLVRSKPKARKGKGKRIAYRFSTKQLPELSRLMNIFYKNGKKIAPSNIKLDPIMLAVWFMDDGSRCSDSDFYLNTQQFSIRDQLKLLDLLRKVGIEGRLNKDKKYFRIRFLLSSIPRFKMIVSDYVIPSMSYKLGYDPVET